MHEVLKSTFEGLYSFIHSRCVQAELVKNLSQSWTPRDNLIQWRRFLFMLYFLCACMSHVQQTKKSDFTVYFCTSVTKSRKTLKSKKFNTFKLGGCSQVESISHLMDSTDADETELNKFMVQCLSSGTKKQIVSVWQRSCFGLKFQTQLENVSMSGWGFSALATFGDFWRLNLKILNENLMKTETLSTAADLRSASILCCSSNTSCRVSKQK